MPTSQNGYSANDRSVIAQYTIPRTQQRISIRKGDVSVILLDLLGWLHLNIEPLDVGIFDDWGYAERTIRGDSTTLSNHASGTAIDANATQHPLGVTGTWTVEEKRLINTRLALYEGCVRWGENYAGRLDGMHFEINRGAVDCKRVADKIRAGQLDPSTTPRDWFDMATEADLRRIIREEVMDARVTREGNLATAGRPTSLRAVIAWIDHLAVNGPWESAAAVGMRSSIDGIAARPVAQVDTAAVVQGVVDAITTQGLGPLVADELARRLTQ